MEPVKYAPPKRDNARKNIFTGFTYDNLFPIDQSNDRVRSIFDCLDEVGIDDQGMIIESRKFNHLALPLSALSANNLGLPGHVFLIGQSSEGLSGSLGRSTLIWSY
jgi:hypothetical protein